MSFGGTSRSMKCGQTLHLAHPAGVHQAEVHHHRMHGQALPGHRHMQQAALLEAVVADVVVAESPIGQRDSSALPCSPWRVTALVR